MSTLSRELEGVLKTRCTKRIVKDVLCKTCRALSRQDAKKEPSWCDTLLTGQLLYKFESNSISVISPSSETEQLERSAIVNRFPYDDRLLTMDEVVSELELPTTMPTTGPYTHLRAHETVLDLVCRLRLEKKNCTPAALSL